MESKNIKDLFEACKFTNENDISYYLIGGGSSIIVIDRRFD